MMPEMCSNSGSVGQLPSGTPGSNNSTSANQRPGSNSRGQSRSASSAQQQPDQSPSSPTQQGQQQGGQQVNSGGSDNEDMGYGDEVISYKDEGETSYAVEELPHAASADTLQDIKCSLVNEPTSHYGANANNNNNHLNNNNPLIKSGPERRNLTMEGNDKNMENSAGSRRLGDKPHSDVHSGATHPSGLPLDYFTRESGLYFGSGSPFANTNSKQAQQTTVNNSSQPPQAGTQQPSQFSPGSNPLSGSAANNTGSTNPSGAPSATQAVHPGFAVAQVALTAAMYSQLAGTELAPAYATAADLDPKNCMPRPGFPQGATGGVPFPPTSYHDFSLPHQWAGAGAMFPGGAHGIHHNPYHPGAGAILPGATHRAAFPFYLGGNMTAEDFEKRNKEHAAVLAHQQQQAVEEQKSYKPYVKKPLNAFMLFMKENREKVMQESTLKESAAINQILGRKWHQLDRTEQAKYYEMARRERAIHLKLYPGWSARDNYAMGKHRKKRKRQGPPQQTLPGVPGVTAHNPKPEFPDIDKKCRARFGMDQQEAWCKHCRRKKKCQFVIKTEDGYQMTVANSGNEDSEDHCSESEECLAAERAEMQQLGAAFGGVGTPNTQSSVGGGLSPLQQHINTSSAPPSSTIPAATDMTIKNNPNSITSSNSSTNQIDPCLSPSSADSTVAAHVAAAGALLAANQTLLPQSSLSRCAGPGQRSVSAAAHTQQNLAPFFAAVASSQHSGFHGLPTSAGNMVSSLPFSSSPHHQFSTAALFPHNIHSTASS